MLNKMQLICAVIVLFVGAVCCQEFPEYLQNFKVNVGAFVSIEEVEIAVKRKCEKNGDADAFNKLETTVYALEEYLISNFNITQIEEEIDRARPTQEFGKVFKKYCDKLPSVQELVKNMYLAAEACLEEEEKPWLELLLNITDTVAFNVCYNDGDRLAMLVEDDGPECLLSRKDDLELCTNETLSSQFPVDYSNSNLLLLTTNKSERCDDFVKFRACVVKALEKCEDGTTAILVGVLLNIIRRILPCTKNPTS